MAADPYIPAGFVEDLDYIAGVQVDDLLPEEFARPAKIVGQLHPPTKWKVITQNAPTEVGDPYPYKWTLQEQVYGKVKSWHRQEQYHWVHRSSGWAQSEQGALMAANDKKHQIEVTRSNEKTEVYL